MKLGLQLGYWSAQPPTNHAELVAAAEEAEFDTVFTAEAWGSDAFTPLAWWGRQTVRMRLGTSVVQLPAPDEQLLGVVMLKLFADRQLQVPPNLVEYLLRRMDRSFAAARQLVENLDRAALSQNRAVTRPLARAVLDKLYQGNA